VTTSPLFCVGPLTVIGSLEDGLRGDYSLLDLKSGLDLIAALTFASALGWGVLLTAGTILLVQGPLTLGAGFVEPFVTDAMISAATATGGVLIVGLGLGLLDSEAGAGREHVARAALRAASGRRGAPLALLAQVLW
jgi:uncharacterized membrane protein YqgA involved in biofilm formation